MKIEQRNNRRFDLRGMDLLVTQDADGISVKGKDVSAGGMGFEIDDVAKVKDREEARISFSVSDSHGGVSTAVISGVVQWKNPEENPPRFGVRIRDLDSNAQEFISRITAEDNISEVRKLELEARNAEIKQHGGNALTITRGMITAALAGVGLSLVQVKFMYIMPLLVIQMGFELYKLELKQIRRLGSYVRCYIEEEVRDLKWEKHLFTFRSLSHAIQPYRDKDKFFTYGYYYMAVWFSIISLILEFANISLIKDRRESLFYTLTYFGVCFYWIFYRISKIREESVAYEGGERVDKEMFNLWRHTKEAEEGFCCNKDHFDDLLQSLWQRDIPRDFGMRRRGDPRKKKSSNKDCFHKNNCAALRVFNKIMTRIKEGSNVPLKASASFPKKWLEALFCAFLYTILLLMSTPIVLPFLKSKSQIEPIMWFFSYYWLIPFLVLGVILRCSKVRVRRVYWARNPLSDDSNIDNGKNKVVRMDDLADNLLPDEEELFPLDYVEIQSVSLLSWVFRYGWDKTWKRERGIWCVSFFGIMLLKKNCMKDFISERWISV